MPNFQTLSQSSDRTSESDAEMNAKESTILDLLNISSDPPIAALTVPMLLVLVGGKAISDGLQSLGQASEEIFRGDRLPILHFPIFTDSDPET